MYQNIKNILPHWFFNIVTIIIYNLCIQDLKLFLTYVKYIYAI